MTLEVGFCFRTPLTYTVPRRPTDPPYPAHPPVVRMLLNCHVRLLLRACALALALSSLFPAVMAQGGKCDALIQCNTSAPSVVLGSGTAASGYRSTAMGSATLAAGHWSTAMGSSTNARYVAPMPLPSMRGATV